MTRLEDLTTGSLVRGVLAERPVRIVQVEWHGSNALTLTYTDESGKPGQELPYRDDESRLAVQEPGRLWSMDADGHLFRLVSEAKRISLAYLFDPFLAVQVSTLEPLPHQIDAVYSRMLPIQPLRFLLADDPGAGKTIMAGLFCKELAIRGDVERCLVIAPGSLVEQWQDELWSKFRLDFEILTRDMIEASRTGNPLAERPLLIARLDHLSRNEDVQARLAATDWDLVVIDEAHKLSAHRFGNEVKETKRYKLGKLAGSIARHLLLMTATPHSGKEEDFQLFMALLDGDRFEGRPRDGAHADTSDLMRRLVKEKLLKFDGTRLFPERRAASPTYPLSDDEMLLYKRVTEYVQEEMNRADRLKAEGEGRRGAVVGFALTTLQRRLASSPEAIYQSLVRRRKRLEARVAEERVHRRGTETTAEIGVPQVPHEFRDIDEGFDVDDLPDGELEDLEEELVDQASAARTIRELEREIARLVELAELASQVRRSGADRKWEELSNLLQHTAEMLDAHGRRRKLIVFTEHRDTLNYLVDRLRGLFGRAEAVVAIHGRMPREERRRTQEAFTQDRSVLVLVATDAAGEGIKPAAGAPDGQLRPAVEPEPHRAAVRSRAPHRPDRGLLPVEPRGRGHPRRRGVPAAVREARGAAQSPRRPGLRRARRVVPGQEPAGVAGRRHPGRQPPDRVQALRVRRGRPGRRRAQRRLGALPRRRPAAPEELEMARPVLDAGWVRDDLEARSLDHGVAQARDHLEEVRRRTVDRVERTAAAVRERLLTEIGYWDHRANQLKDQELAGRLPKSGMNSAKARQRADELEARLERRLDELDAERQLSALPPVVVGGALTLPAGLLARLRGSVTDPAGWARETERVERAAVDAVLAVEHSLGRTPVEMSRNNKGYDIVRRQRRPAVRRHQRDLRLEAARRPLRGAGATVTWRAEPCGSPT